MSLLIVQAIVKQWDKSQRTLAHRMARSKIPDRQAVLMPPAVYAFDKRLLLDMHGQYEYGRVKCQVIGVDKIRCDRLQVDLTGRDVTYLDAPKSAQAPRFIGRLEKGIWLQCKYNWRYSVYRNDFYYWLYEDVILNVALVNEYEEAVFINTDPAIVFEDFDLVD